MTEPDRKVYDSDLVVTPLLREIAHEYCRRYIGNFDMMIAAKQFFQDYGVLKNGMYRPVLNTLRTDPLQPDLWNAVRAVLAPVRQPLPDGLAEVVPMRRPTRRQTGSPPIREVYLRLREDQYKVKGIFATAIHRSNSPVLHWVTPSGHRVEWQLKWDTDRHYHDVCAVGSNHPREFRLRPTTFCKPLGQYKLWLHRPTMGEAYNLKVGDKYLHNSPIPDCKSCLRNIALSYLDYYPPDRDPETGEYRSDG